MSQKFAVIGLGVLGRNLSLQLAKSGEEVIAIDSIMDRVDDIKDDVTVAVCLDATNERALAAQDLKNVNCAVVCIGENFEANVLATVLLKKMGVRKVITRASRDIERQILREVGADELIYPEQDMATELAVRLTAKSILELIPLSATLQAAKIYAPSAFWGQSLKDLSLRSEYGINIISIYESNELRDRDAMIPHPDTVIKEGQVLLVVGEEQAIKRLSQMD